MIVITQVTHDAHFYQITLEEDDISSMTLSSALSYLALWSVVLTSEAPGSIRILTLVSVTIRHQLHLHHPGVSQLVEGGEEHGVDEVPAAGAQGLVVELHLDWLRVRRDVQ